MKNDKYYRRGFLNNNEGVSIFEALANGRGKAGDATFVLSDCSRQITLDFSWWNGGRTRQQAIAKIDNIVNELESMKLYIMSLE